MSIFPLMTITIEILYMNKNYFVSFTKQLMKMVTHECLIAYFRSNF